MIKVQKSMWSVDGKYCYVEKMMVVQVRNMARKLIFGEKNQNRNFISEKNQIYNNVNHY